MEKIVVVNRFLSLSPSDVKEVSDHLSMGWSVKHMNMCATKDYVNIVFVLEKPASQ